MFSEGWRLWHGLHLKINMSPAQKFVPYYPQYVNVYDGIHYATKNPILVGLSKLALLTHKLSGDASAYENLKTIQSRFKDDTNIFQNK